MGMQLLHHYLRADRYLLKKVFDVFIDHADAANGFFGPPGTPLAKRAYFPGFRLIILAVGVHDGHTAFRPTFACPLKARPARPTPIP